MRCSSSVCQRPVWTQPQLLSEHKKDLSFKLWLLYSKTFQCDSWHTHKTELLLYSWEKPKTIKEWNVQHWVKNLKQSPTWTAMLFILHKQAPPQLCCVNLHHSWKTVLFSQLNLPLNAMQVGLLGLATLSWLSENFVGTVNKEWHFPEEKHTWHKQLYKNNEGRPHSLKGSRL